MKQQEVSTIVGTNNKSVGAGIILREHNSTSDNVDNSIPIANVNGDTIVQLTILG